MGDPDDPKQFTGVDVVTTEVSAPVPQVTAVESELMVVPTCPPASSSKCTFLTIWSSVLEAPAPVIAKLKVSHLIFTGSPAAYRLNFASVTPDCPFAMLPVGVSEAAVKVIVPALMDTCVPVFEEPEIGTLYCE